MAANKYIKLNTTTGRLEQTSASQVGGSGHGGELVALGDDGLIPDTMISSAAGAGTVSCIADTNLTAGNFVNIFYTSSQRRARKATATDHTIPVNGYVKDAITAAASGLVYVGGLNTAYPIGTFTAADTGKRVFLSTTAGEVTLTPPSATGNLIQVVGVIDAVDTGASIIWINTNSITDGVVV
jgi:hypothetical protein